MNLCKSYRYITLLALVFLLTVTCRPIYSGTLNISDIPLLSAKVGQPLTMLVLGRDHHLYQSAYIHPYDPENTGNIQYRFNPSSEYSGMFDSESCYVYHNSGFFYAASTTTNGKCGGQWSGNFLNYLTMTRMDLVRSALYGGHRSVDNAQYSILQRTNIPNDGHTFGIDYTSATVDGFDISQYAPIAQPEVGKHHILVNTTNDSGDTRSPMLRGLLNVNARVWDWLSLRNPEANTVNLNGSDFTPTNVYVQIIPCVYNLEKNCKLYSSRIGKPIGILQEYGENDAVHFGLISGSYDRNLAGGVLRAHIGSVANQFNQTSGVIESGQKLVNQLDNFQYLTTSGSFNNPISCPPRYTLTLASNCYMWGNSLGEMTYEATRYFHGKTSPTSEFISGSRVENAMGLIKENWSSNPISSYPKCSKANIVIVSPDITAYDSTELPNTVFSSFRGNVSPTMNVATLGQTIWNGEYGGTKQFFIGHSGSNDDTLPTPKDITSFGNIRGTAPSDTALKGSYLSSSITYYNHETDISGDGTGKYIKTYVLALSGDSNKIIIPVAGKRITLIPFAKSVQGGGINASESRFQPNNQITNMYIDTINSNEGIFVVSFDAASTGADYNTDALVRYRYYINPDNTIDITLESLKANDNITQHIGYVISGTTQDGVYLEVRDTNTSAGNDIDYYMDTPPGEPPGGNWSDSADLPLTASRNFTVNATGSKPLLKSPLWYAAKWGGFNDLNNNGTPDQSIEWDTDNDGVPDNYFLLQNVSKLKGQIKKVFNEISNGNGKLSLAQLASNSGSLNDTTYLYQIIYDEISWNGHLLAFPVDKTTGKVNISGRALNGATWDGADKLAAQAKANNRTILTYKPSTKKGISFRWPSDPRHPSTTELDTVQSTALSTNPDSGSTDDNGRARLDALRGVANSDRALRSAGSRLGDTIDAAPIYVKHVDSSDAATWITSYGDAYGVKNRSLLRGDITQHISANSNASKDTLFVAANDGMLHAFSASDGTERFAYIPNATFNKLNELTSLNYNHFYYVNGTPTIAHVYDDTVKTILVGGLRQGGQGIYALNVSDTTAISEGNAANVALWEFTDSNDADLGYTFSKPAIVRLANDKLAAVFGNGYNNTENDGNVSITGNAVLYIVDLKDGTLIKKIDTGVGMLSDPNSTNRPNGLSTPSVVDADDNGIADYIYAGDLFGNLWKFDISSNNPTNWGVALGGLPLFTARDSRGKAQPITVEPKVQRAGNGALQIFFGTGQYFETQDKNPNNASLQTFYGIIDNKSTPIISRNQLLQQTITYQAMQTFDNGAAFNVRLTSSNALQSIHRGWYMDLVYNNVVDGERVVYDAAIRNENIIFTTLTPPVDCDAKGNSWLMELRAKDGSALNTSPFDLNGDKLFDINDYVDNGNGPVPVSGIASLDGIMPNPLILSGGGDVDFKYSPGTSGTIQTFTENPSNDQTRQSWIQLL